MTPKSNTLFGFSHQAHRRRAALASSGQRQNTLHTGRGSTLTQTSTRRHGDGTQSPHKTITQSSHGGTQADRPSRSHALATASHASCVPRECSVMLTSLRCLIHAITKALTAFVWDTGYDPPCYGRWPLRVSASTATASQGGLGLGLACSFSS